MSGPELCMRLHALVNRLYGETSGRATYHMRVRSGILAQYLEFVEANSLITPSPRRGGFSALVNDKAFITAK